VESKTTGANFIPFDVSKVEAFARVRIHLFLLDVLGGHQALVWPNSRECDRGSVGKELLRKSGVGVWLGGDGWEDV
jgi:hypothetical protein